MAPKNFDHGCWSCGVTAMHHTLINTPKYLKTRVGAGAWMCFPCRATYLDLYPQRSTE